VALAKVAHERLYETGDAYITLTEIEEIAQQHGTPEAIARHVLRSLDVEGLLVTDDGHLYKGDIELAILYEDRYDRPTLWKANELRREILKRAAEAFERDEFEVDYQEKGERFIDAPFGEATTAARALEHLSLVRLRLPLGRNFAVSIEPRGYDLARDDAALRRELPTSASEDEEAHAAVAPDALSALITSVDQMLRERAWDDARSELAEGDRQYNAGHSHLPGSPLLLRRPRGIQRWRWLAGVLRTCDHSAARAARRPLSSH
jgi:hypothetical protein